MLALGHFEMLENEGFVRARAEGFAECEENHGERVEGKSGEKIKNDEGDQVGDESHDHRLATPESIGKDAGGDLEDIRRHIADGVEEADLKKAQPRFTENENDEGVEEAQVFEKTVGGEAGEEFVVF